MNIGLINSIGRRRGGENINVTQIAQAHYDRVVADGGTLPSLSKLTDFLTDYYAIRKTAKDTNILCDPHLLGYKLSSNKLTKLYDLTGNDFYQQTSVNMPVFQNWDEVNGNYFINTMGVANNSIQSEKLAITNLSDLDIIFHINITDITSSNNIIFERRDSTSGNFRVFISAGLMRAWFWLDGTILITTSQAVTIGNKWYRIKRIAATGNVIFYSSDTRGNWTIMSTKTGLTAGNFTDGTIVNSIGVTCRFRIYEIEIWNGDSDAGGIRIEHYNSNDYNPGVDRNKVVSASTGRIFNINRDSGITGIKGEIIYRNTALFDGINHRITRTSNYAGSITNYYDGLYPDAYQVLEDIQDIGYAQGIYKITKSATLYSVKRTDPIQIRTAMQALYQNYFLNSDFFNVRLFGQNEELEQETEYNQ